MAVFEKTNDFLGRYKRIVPVTKVLRPVFSVLFYVLCVFFALFAIVALIVALVDVDVDKMLLPPHMKAMRDAAGSITHYSLKLGNGIKIISEADTITLGHIKLVVYAKIVSWCVTFVAAAPAFLFISKLFKNVNNNDVLSGQNAAYINYTGMLIIVGNIVHTIVNNLFNYLQIKKFVTTSAFEFSFDIQWFGIVTGVFIIIIGTIYGYSCAYASNNATPLSAGNSIVIKESDK